MHGNSIPHLAPARHALMAYDDTTGHAARKDAPKALFCTSLMPVVLTLNAQSPAYVAGASYMFDVIRNKEEKDENVG